MAEATRPTREPKASTFTQQELKALRPVLTPLQVIFVYWTVGLALIPIGAVCLRASKEVTELSRRYDSAEGCIPPGTSTEAKIAFMQDPNRPYDPSCSVKFEATKTMRAPIYVYYELTDYYQNHRRYVKSRNDDQLAGKSGGDKSDCKPKLYQHSRAQKEDHDFPIKPCGLTAWSFFNDTFQVDWPDEFGVNSQMIEEGIAWKSDIEHLFGDYEAENFNNRPAFRGGAEISGSVRENEHFIVWMRVAALPKFRKLYGILNRDLEEGETLTFNVTNRYNTYLFDGEKNIVLSTTTWQGGRNPFLGIIYIVAGCCFIFTGFIYFLLHVQFPRTVGDQRFLSWQRKNR